MQRVSKRVMSWLLTLAVIVSMIPNALAAESNTAQRHKDATNLSTQAQAYYTGKDSIDNLYKLPGDGSGKSYNGMSSDLYKELQSLMERTMTTTVSYKSLTTYWKTTDTNSNGYYCFYGDAPESNPNREHVWPKSRGSFHESYAGADLHHLRPTNTTINSTRGNMTMGNVREKYPGSYSTANFAGKPTLYYNTGADLVEVNNDIKGDVARIFLYVYVRWGEPNLFENVPSNQLPSPRGSDSGGNNGARVIDDLDTLLQWCQNDPVDEWEMTRNDLTQDIQGNRNVFIDYPELAWKLFNKPIPAGMTTPSGGKGGVEPPDPIYQLNVFPETPGTGTVAYSAGYITTTPSEGYYTAGATVEPLDAATVTQSGNSFVVSNVTKSCTILIKFAPKQIASIGYALPEGVTTNGPVKGYLGEAVTLPQVAGTPTNNSRDYTFMGWVEDVVNATKDRSEFILLAPGFSYTLKNTRTTFYALYSYRVEDGSGAADSFVLVTTDPIDWSGDYVITNSGGDTLLLTTGEGINTNGNAVLVGTTGSVTKTGNTLSGVTADYVITVAPAGSGKYTLCLKGASDVSYLNYPGSGNALGISADPSDPKAQWTLESSSSNVVITNAGNTSYQLKWNGSWKGFRCYPSGQENVRLFAATGGAFSTYYLTLGEGTPPGPDPIANIGYAVPDGVTIVSGPTTGVVGQPITLPSVTGTPEDNSKDYTFVGWADEKVNDTTTRPTIYATGSAYTIKAAATKLYALFTYTTTETGGSSEEYNLVKSIDDLKANDKVVVISKNEDKLVNRNSYFAMSSDHNSQAKNNRKAVAVTLSGETVTISDKVAVLTLENGVEAKPGTFAFKTADGKYLEVTGMAAEPGKGNWLVNGDKTENASWKIEMTDGAAIVTAQGDMTANIMRYNPNLKSGSTTEVNGDSIFSAYGPESSVKGEATNIVLYKLTTGSGGTVEVTHYLTLADGGDVPPPDPDPDPVATPIASPKSGEVAKDTSLTLSCATAGAEIYYTLDGSAPTKNSTKYTAPIKITGEMTIKFIAVKSGMADSPVVMETYTVKKANPGTTPPTGGNGGGTKANPIVKAEDVKVDDGSAEIKLPSADAKLDDAANQKVVSANATKSVAITGGGLNIIIPAGTLTVGADVNALLVDPKASGGVIKVTKPDGTTAILPIATISGGQAAYVANIPGKYEVIDNSKTFPDANNHWALPAIGFVSARELFKGDSAGAFSPDQPMTRGMLATVLARIDGGKTGGGAPFSDVPTSAWYAKEISWAAQNKLVEGDGKNFKPEENLTREQLCVILARYLDYSGLYLSEITTMGSFSDMGAVSPWAKSAVEQAVKAGLIDGKAGGTLDPQGKATRAEIATILQRFVEGVLK
jgi:endonuclease I